VPGPSYAVVARGAGTHLSRVVCTLGRRDQPFPEVHALSLGELARDARLSSFHFLRVFRRVAGVTPHQYLIGARLRRALGLLLDTELPVTRVAYDAGFADLSSFDHTFRSAIGCSPRAYRRGMLRGVAVRPLQDA
jgi:AraC-like DNA-binding protein